MNTSPEGPAGPLPKCSYLVTYDLHGMLPRPRPCARTAKAGTVYCPQHGRVAAKWTAIDVSLAGGFCVWCPGKPGAAYTRGGVRIVLCRECSVSLARSIRAHTCDR